MYQSIDPVIQEWARNNNLQVYNSYKGDEVRSVEYREGPRRGYQIWIDVPNAENLVQIHVWNFRNLRRVFTVDASELYDYLQRSLTLAKSWLE